MVKTRRNRNRAQRGAEARNVESLKKWGNQSCPFPPEHRAKLRYSSYVVGDPAGGAVENQLISGNSIFDPDATGVGEQPYYFDQLTAIYKNYFVVRSSVKIIVTSTSAIFARCVLLPLLETGSLSSDSYETSEQPFAKTTMVSGNSAGPVIARLKSSMDTHRIIGISYQQALGRESLHSDYTTNPVYRWYWAIQVQDVGNLTSTLSCFVEYVVTYDVIFSGLRTNGDSVSVPLSEGLLLHRSRDHKNKQKLLQQQQPTKGGDPVEIPADIKPPPQPRYLSVQPIASTALVCASCSACSAQQAAKTI